MNSRNLVSFILLLSIFVSAAFAQQTPTLSTDLRVRRTADPAGTYAFRHSGDGFFRSFNAAGVETSSWDAETGEFAGTIGEGNLPANVALLDAASQTFTGSLDVTGNVTAIDGNFTNLEAGTSFVQPSGQVFEVSADGSREFTTIQAALTAATDPLVDKTILLYPGTYNLANDTTLDVTVDKTHIVGISRDSVIINGNVEMFQGVNDFGATIVISADDCSLENLTLTNTAEVGDTENFKASALRVGYGSGVPGAVTATGFRANNCSFIGYTATAASWDVIWVRASGDGARFDSCYVRGFSDIISADGSYTFRNGEIETTSGTGYPIWVNGDQAAIVTFQDVNISGPFAGYVAFGFDGATVNLINVSSTYSPGSLPAYFNSVIATTGNLFLSGTKGVDTFDGAHAVDVTFLPYAAGDMASSFIAHSTFLGGLTSNLGMGFYDPDYGMTANITYDGGGDVFNFTSTEGSQAGASFQGAITATSFNGSGVTLTNLNASNLASGTVPDARFPATLPAVSGALLTGVAKTGSVNTFTEDQTVNGTVTATAFVGDGSGLTGVSGGGGSVATLSDVTLGTLADNEVLTYDTATSKWINAAAASGGTVAAGDITAGTLDTDVVVPAANLTGSVADARLSANVALENAGNVFTTGQTWSNGGAISGGTFNVSSLATFTGGDTVVGNDGTITYKEGANTGITAGVRPGDQYAFMFQQQQANGGVSVFVIPKTPGAVRRSKFSIFGTDLVADSTHFLQFDVGYEPLYGSQIWFNSRDTGSYTAYPMVFGINTAEKLRVDTDGVDVTGALSVTGASTLGNITANAAGITEHIFQQGAAEKFKVHATGATVTGDFQSTNYKAGDGTVGIDASFTINDSVTGGANEFVFKDGLLTMHSVTF